ncbi:GD13198 [Drosophila simulans]|uniref:GD13198 n=1 Tax=Drosophila simulans TaxID=7240 RepID=B4QRK5_DROSI|nr:GD13198 [Drosophila simulans]
MADDKSAVVINAAATSGSKKQKKKKNKGRSKGTQKATSRPLTMPVSAKDALMVLNELKGVTIDKMEVKRKHDGIIMAYIVVNSKKYEGKGSSLASARNAACEKALQGILTTKMKAVLDQPENSSGSDEDDLLGKMASYAVHKLAEEWKSNDIDVAAVYNDLKKKLTPGVDPKASSPGKPLPKSWKNMDPCMVLTYMRPQINFKVSGSTGTNQNKTFSMTARVDNCEFNADGPSKTVARYKLNALVCNKLFGTEYPQK